MGYRQTVPLVFLALVVLSSRASSSDAARPASAAKAVAMDTVTKIKVGSSTKADVAELMGTPLRSVNDEDCISVGYQGETWEYLGQDSFGNFKINIQFDSGGIARLISRSTAKGTVVVLASAPPPNHAHQH